MTYKERLIADHPEWDLRKICSAIDSGCPSDYGYRKAKDEDNCNAECSYCWEQEMPEENTFEGSVRKLSNLARETGKAMVNAFKGAADNAKLMLEVDGYIKETKDSFFKRVQEATAQAMADGIKANSIIINENMVRVDGAWIPTPLGARGLPKMICGLNVYLTKDELPEGYSFAVFEGPNDRLAEFESIGMEPSELRKAAALYRKVKEVLE